MRRERQAEQPADRTKFELIAERYEQEVDMVIDGGYGTLLPTTLVDLTGEEPEILREGKGDLQ